MRTGVTDLRLFFVPDAELTVVARSVGLSRRRYAWPAGHTTGLHR